MDCLNLSSHYIALQVPCHGWCNIYSGNFLLADIDIVHSRFVVMLFVVEANPLSADDFWRADLLGRADLLEADLFWPSLLATKSPRLSLLSSPAKLEADLF